MRASSSLRLVLGVLCCALLGALAASPPPQAKTTRFGALPAALVYFPDSPVVLYHDAAHGVVHRSADEGATWKTVDGSTGAPNKGEVAMVVLHPGDRTTAFILTSGTTHYRTSNRGESWQSFRVPLPPATRSGPPLEFNRDEQNGASRIIYAGKKCSSWSPWGQAMCHDIAYYTLDGFKTDPKPLIELLVHCMWAKASPTVALPKEKIDRIYCIAWDDSPTGGGVKVSSRSDDPSHLLHSRAPALAMTRRAESGAPTRLFYSDDFFATKTQVTMDLGRDAKNFVGLGPSGSYLVTALRDISSSTGGNAGNEMAMFVSRNGQDWTKAKFPHGAGLKEGAYTVVEGTTHSLVVDVLDPSLGTGRLFTSDSEGSHFVQSLDMTHRNSRGIVDYEHLQNVQGAAIANTQTGGFGEEKVRSKATWDDGSRWSPLQAPDGMCKGQKPEDCSLHLYSVSRLHNSGPVFSSTAPGFVMGVGSVGNRLQMYEECDTFLSTDAGRSWKRVAQDAHKYEFGDQGGILVIVNDEQMTDHVKFSRDFGKTWEEFKLGTSIIAKLLTTVPDSTSQKFLLIGTQSRKEAGSEFRHVAIFLDFATQKKRVCDRSKDMERWYAGSGAPDAASQCLLGHKQWYLRRKPDADCAVGDKFNEVPPQMEDCPCTDADYECDFGFVAAADGSCKPSMPEHIPAEDCRGSSKTFMGSSGYRKIPGDTCKGGKVKDGKVAKPCAEGTKPENGEVLTRHHEFPGKVLDRAWFSDSPNLLVQVSDGSVWQSNNDGYTWVKPELNVDLRDPDARFLTMAMHTYDKARAYLITSGRRVHYTFDSGRTWDYFSAPNDANGLGIPILDFHPERSDWLIWTGSKDCTDATSSSCHTSAYYTLDQGRTWTLLDDYVRICSWARDAAFHVDTSAIICESYATKEGNQKAFGADNPLQLIWGANYYSRKETLFPAVIGFATFEEFLVVAELVPKSDAVALKVSLDGRIFAPAQFPPNTRIDNSRAYTVLDSVTKAIFLHVTTHATPGSPWGAIFKSNSNGTYFALSLDHVNRNDQGYADFEKMLGLDGIALVNVVGNADDASVSGKKELQTRITHNDGGKWKELIPPVRDVNGQPYECNSVGCSLHLHGYSERDDPQALYSSPTAVGIMLGVGNVGKSLKPYADCDTFMTRDGGFSWEEVHKDAHKWEFGDQGSIILLVNDEAPTDVVLYSLDEGKTWKSHSIGQKLRVQSIMTVPEDTHRKFVLLGTSPGTQERTLAVHLDFSTLQRRKCELDPRRPEQDDFELWSPSEEREEPCLFGRQTYYYRRKPRADCYVGQVLVQPHEVRKNCSCTAADFECEFNHYLDPDGSGRCLPYSNTALLPAHIEEQCDADGGQDYWYERTSVRKVPYSTCDGGPRPDHGKQHTCPASFRRHGFFWWTTVLLSPFGLAALVGIWWQKKHRGGAIRLPDARDYVDGNVVDTLASIPSFVVGVAHIVIIKVLDIAEEMPWVRRQLGRMRGYGGTPYGRGGSYGGYSNLSTEEDAAILGGYGDDDEAR